MDDKSENTPHSKERIFLGMTLGKYKASFLLLYRQHQKMFPAIMKHAVTLNYFCIVAMVYVRAIFKTASVVQGLKMHPRVLTRKS